MKQSCPSPAPTYADMKAKVLSGQLPLGRPQNWVLSLEIFAQAIERPLETVDVSFERFKELFPLEKENATLAPGFIGEAMYRRWWRNMEILHRFVGGTGDAWADLIAIGHRFEELGTWVGRISDIRASLTIAGLGHLAPGEVDRPHALAANDKIRGPERVRLRAACNSLDLLRAKDVVRERGLLPPESIGFLPKRSRSGTILDDLPPGLNMFEDKPSQVQDAIRAVYFTARKLGAIEGDDVGPAALLEAITKDNRVFDDMLARMSQGTVTQYRQRAFKHLGHTRRPNYPKGSWDDLYAELRSALPGNAKSVLQRLSTLRASAHKAGLLPNQITTDFVVQAMNEAPQAILPLYRSAARLLNELREVGPEFSRFVSDSPIDLSALPGQSGSVRTKGLKDLMR